MCILLIKCSTFHFCNRTKCSVKTSVPLTAPYHSQQQPLTLCLQACSTSNVCCPHTQSQCAKTFVLISFLKSLRECGFNVLPVIIGIAEGWLRSPDQWSLQFCRQPPVWCMGLSQILHGTDQPFIKCKQEYYFYRRQLNDLHVDCRKCQKFTCMSSQNGLAGSLVT